MFFYDVKFTSRNARLSLQLEPNTVVQVR